MEQNLDRPWVQRERNYSWLVPALVAMLLVVYSLGALQIGVTEMFVELRENLQLTVLASLTVSPLLALALWDTRARLDLVLWSVGIYIVFYLVISAPPIHSALALAWNWQGQALCIPVSLLVIFGFQQVTAAEFGLRWRLAPGSWRPFAIWTVIAAAVFFAAGYGNTTRLDTLLIQWTMPGLNEELMFRGVLLALLSQAFGRPWRIGGVPVGWGLVLASTMFGVMHGFTFDANGAIQFSTLPILATSLLGLLLGWVRLRTGSLWPAILLHNVMNGSTELAALLSGGLTN